MNQEIFESCLRSAGDLAGVFEHDGETGYFYLYRDQEDAQQILGHIHIVNSASGLSARDISIHWTHDEEKVGLFIRGVLWAVFDTRNNCKYGGGYRINQKPTLPAELIRDFEAV
jgi:hypothetical protein